MSRVTILGDGGWGTALALVLRRNGHRVRVWGPFPDYIAEIRATAVNRKFLPGVDLPNGIEWTSDPAGAMAGTEVAVLAIPSRYFSDTLSKFAPLMGRPGPVVMSVTKGLDQATSRRMTEVAEGILECGPVAALSGPSLAGEVARGIPAAVTIACANPDRARMLQHVFMNPVFRIYTSDDVVGVELGGALKNVIAIAAGVCDGIGFGDNAKAALITRGLAEITRIGCAMGAHRSTFAGLSGMGDLVVTCTSRQSRNRGVGERIGRGEKIETILAGMEQVAEGVWTCATARNLAMEQGVEVPIAEEVCALVGDGKNPHEAVQSLMTRDPKPERD